MTIVDNTRQLVADGLYNAYGRVYIATPENTLVPLVGDRTNVIDPTGDMEITHIADPKTDEWNLRILRALNVTNRDMLNEQRSHQYLKGYVERLGEALLEKAEEKDWCSEYDDFADEWDLPHRYRMYEVTVVLQVKAKNEDDAVEMVENNTRFSCEIEDGPSVSAEEA